jgi:hypothetical protein
MKSRFWGIGERGKLEVRDNCFIDFVFLPTEFPEKKKSPTLSESLLALALASFI